MSIYSRIKSEQPVETVVKEKTPFFMSNTNKGFECLIFKNDETCKDLHDEGGHNITFYPNGALLSLKESCKYHPTSKSFLFFNNKGEKVFEMYNSIKVRNPETHHTEFLPPKKDIDVTIYNGFILVKEISFEDNSKKEYFVSVKTGEIVPDFGIEEEQTYTP